MLKTLALPFFFSCTLLISSLQLHLLQVALRCLQFIISILVMAAATRSPTGGTPAWQHPYVNIFRAWQVPRWKIATREGQVQRVLVSH